MNDQMIFGFPEFGQTVYKEFGPQLNLTHAHSILANEMLGRLPKNIKSEQVVIYVLVRMTLSSWVELLILCGHGAGLGGLKIMRGMFETSVMAEYLRLNPEEIDDYLDYGNVSFFKRLKLFGKTLKPGIAENVERQYERVKAKFLTKEGKVRNQWNRHSISYMADKVGRGAQYEVGYSIAASIHHGNFEAMTAHLADVKRSLEIEHPPSLEWIPQALAYGHLCLLAALNTLNECFALDSRLALDEAKTALEQVWKEYALRPRPQT